eukprot:Anaeramoba_ignava/a92356_36.p1 GENE.a92356_36~~a92356_36.p1  ORF type:complete len:164 (-),score=10.90 a92356_36:140-631(-)
MIVIKVEQSDIDFAKNQIEEFKKIKAGQWRYSGVEAWRGIVCEMITSNWLKEKFNVEEEATGLLPTGIEDAYDLIISGKKIEIKSATKNYFRSIMPKIHDVNNHPKDIYIGVKYNETVNPNEIKILGFMSRDKILQYPREQNKGAPYYNVPLTDLTPIEQLKF